MPRSRVDAVKYLEMSPLMEENKSKSEEATAKRVLNHNKYDEVRTAPRQARHA